MSGTIILLIVVLNIGIPKIAGMIIAMDKALFILSAAGFLCALILKCIRWQVLISPLGVKDTILSAYSYNFGQLINEILPTGSGEIARILIIKRKYDIGFISLVPAILIERFYDIVLLFIVSALLVSRYLNPVFVVILVTFIFVIVLIFIKPSLLQLISMALNTIKQNSNNIANLLHFISQKIDEMTRSIEFYHKRWTVMLVNAFLTIISWAVFELISHYLLLRGFGFSIPILTLFGALSVSWILGSFSMLPGGIGVFETAYALVLSSFGIPFEVGVSMAVLYRITICLLIACLTGIFYIINIKNSKSSVSSNINNFLEHKL